MGKGGLPKLFDAFQETGSSLIRIYTLNRIPAELYIIQVNHAKLDPIAQAIAIKLDDDRIRAY